MESMNIAMQEKIFSQYKKGANEKAQVGERGILEQAKINERFFMGDQWYGVQAGNSRPLVRRNLIKRIGEYKISAVGASPVAVNYSADGVTVLNTDDNLLSRFDRLRQNPSEIVSDSEISCVMSALSSYQSVTAERVGLQAQLESALRNAYISGTAFIFTYWDDSVCTGLYADDQKTTAISGDINCQVLGVENVVLGDFNCDELQNQPYIIIAERKLLSDVKREAEMFGADLKFEPSDDTHITVLTKLYKEYTTNRDYKIMAVKVCEQGVIREPWDLKIKRYPLAMLCWDKRNGCAWGESEITYLLGNQIAINRALTAAVWATMSAGMPKMIVNDGYCRDIKITNDPGQIIRVPVADTPLDEVVKYVEPPTFAPQFQTLVSELATNTLLDSGANDVALGNVRPDNASAIIEIRQAALQPIQIYQNRFYRFCEDVAAVWMEFWLRLYGQRKIKLCQNKEVHFIPLEFSRYKDLIIRTKVDVGAATLWSEAACIETLGNLLEQGIINRRQYLERLPKGVIPDVDRLINDEKATTEDDELLLRLKAKYPAAYDTFKALPETEQSQILSELYEKEGAQ